MNAVQIRFYDLLRKDLHLSDDKAADFATREDISHVREDIHKLELKLEQSKGDIYKAMFWTGIVQLLAILGGVLAIVKFASS